MRQADVDEINAVGGLSPLDGILTGVIHGPSWAIVHDGQVIGIFGVGDHPWFRNVGIVWMLASPEIASPQVKRQFLQRSRKLCDCLNERYAVLTNFIDARNTLHLRWLKWMGFRVVRTVEEYGEGRLPFHEFVRIKQCASS